MNENDHTMLENEIGEALNRACAENDSNTPDFILAQFLMGCLGAWTAALQRRSAWYGRTDTPGSSDSARTDAPTGGPPLAEAGKESK
mgnify:CR=1 FL=1